MRNVETYRGSGEYVTALSDDDMASLQPEFDRIRIEWYREWVRRGSVDEGSCCLGVGVSVFHLPGRKRTPVRKQVISWTWSQGDLEADRTRHLPLGMLADLGVPGFYNCGFMD